VEGEGGWGREGGGGSSSEKCSSSIGAESRGCVRTCNTFSCYILSANITYKAHNYLRRSCGVVLHAALLHLHVNDGCSGGRGSNVIVYAADNARVCVHFISPRVIRVALSCTAVSRVRHNSYTNHTRASPSAFTRRASCSSRSSCRKWFSTNLSYSLVIDLLRLSGLATDVSIWRVCLEGICSWPLKDRRARTISLQTPLTLTVIPLSSSSNTAL